MNREVMVQALLALGTGRFVGLRCLAEWVQRRPAALQDQYLTGLVRDRRLSLAFPKTPNHERQAYTKAPEVSP